MHIMKVNFLYGFIISTFLAVHCTATDDLNDLAIVEIVADPDEQIIGNCSNPIVNIRHLKWSRRSYCVDACGGMQTATCHAESGACICENCVVQINGGFCPIANNDRMSRQECHKTCKKNCPGGRSNGILCGELEQLEDLPFAICTCNCIPSKEKCPTNKENHNDINLRNSNSTVRHSIRIPNIPNVKPSPTPTNGNSQANPKLHFGITDFSQLFHYKKNEFSIEFRPLGVLLNILHGNSKLKKHSYK